MYFWGKSSSDDLVSKRSKDLTGISSPATRWWHFVTDHQFSVRAVIDGSSKAVHERAEYDAHGRPKVWLGADIYPINGPDGQINTFDYSSQYITWFNAQDPDLRADLELKPGDIGADSDAFLDGGRTISLAIAWSPSIGGSPFHVTSPANPVLADVLANPLHRRNNSLSLPSADIGRSDMVPKRASGACDSALD